MKIFNYKKFLGGWYIGQFKPTAFNTRHCEVAVKNYKAGEIDLPHYHKVATELTFVLRGVIQINKKIS